MRLRTLKKSAWGVGGVVTLEFEKDEIIDVPEEDALLMIEHGYASELEEPKKEETIDVPEEEPKPKKKKKAKK